MTPHLLCWWVHITLEPPNSPHDLELSDPTDRIWTYKSSSGELECSEKKFMARAGSAAIWHACTLHGTTPAKSTNARISLRYLLTSRQIGNRPNIVEIMNTKLFGSASQKMTRRDQNSLAKSLNLAINLSRASWINENCCHTSAWGQQENTQ